MKRVFTLLTLIAGLASHTSLADFICWDGTFAYNAAGFFEKDNRFELTLRGANLGPLTFDFLHQRVAISGNNFSGTQIHIAFRKDECTQDRFTQSWFCHSKAKGIKRNVFVDHDVNDLEKDVNVISSTQVDRIDATITKGSSVSVTFSDDHAPDSGRILVQTVNLSLPHCDRLEWGGMEGTRFPERLEQHLTPTPFF
jgi:hypothetical protein